MTRRIYISSSWKNPYVNDAVTKFRAAGHTVFNFREANADFHWAQCTTEDRPDHYRLLQADAMQRVHACPVVKQAFYKDRGGLETSDTLVLILPAGNSAHIEYGYAQASNMFCYVLAPLGIKLDLMYHGGLFFQTEEEIIKKIAEDDGYFTDLERAVATGTIAEE